ncbi:MAG: PrpR N-terminal domain-containing protein [Tepidanaerobacteraceae bacterium]
MSHKIAIIAPYAGLSDAAQQVCSELEAEAEIVVGDLDEGVKAARKLIDQGVEVIISRGGTATAITNQLDEPVVEIIVSPYDIIRAVASAKRYGRPYRHRRISECYIWQQKLGRSIRCKNRGT